jgi:hypothetical protein
MVVRHDVNVEAIGQMAALPPDLSPLQLGTTGQIDTQSFTLIGRVRLGYEEGTWNEWCALFGDGRYGWVAEAQGIFMVTFAINALPGIKQGNLSLGSYIKIEGHTFQTVDRKRVTCLGSEGELPFVAAPGRESWSIDLAGPGELFASADFSEDGNRFYSGRYARFNDLNFSNLREVPGWSDNPMTRQERKTTSINCPNCGGATELRAAGFSMSATCSSCGSLMDTATPEVQLIREVSQKQRINPIIPLGSRGALFGIVYEVIGFQEVRDPYSGWHEYLLFNPWQGFLWLVAYQGHWSVVRRLFARPKVDEPLFGSAATVKFEDRRYRLFANSAVSTSYVLGEFYWKVAIGMSVEVKDFISPPYILSREGYDKLAEVTWSQGEYIEGAILEQAFNLPGKLGEPIGPYLNQPNPHAGQARQLRWLVPILLFALILVQTVSCKRAAKEQVFAAQFNYHNGATNPIVTEPFEIRGSSKQAVEFTMHAPVNNNWIEVGVDLVNAENQKVEASFEQGIEYYSGYDDGAWSEGNSTEHHLVCSVPPGKYYLAMESTADPAVADMAFDVKVVRDVVVWANFWIALCVILLYPLYRIFRAHSFERSRWMESDFSPYASFSSDDDD